MQGDSIGGKVSEPGNLIPTKILEIYKLYIFAQIANIYGILFNVFLEIIQI